MEEALLIFPPTIRNLMSMCATAFTFLIFQSVSFPPPVLYMPVQELSHLKARTSYPGIRVSLPSVQCAAAGANAKLFMVAPGFCLRIKLNKMVIKARASKPFVYCFYSLNIVAALCRRRPGVRSRFSAAIHRFMSLGYAWIARRLLEAARPAGRQKNQ